jgi:7,8-dihydroneopterin aldolase/epimerase/oxygenase
MRVYIEDLTFKCIIGILDFERVKKQKVIINLYFDYEFKDDKFINYAEVSSLIKEIMKKEKFELLEDAILTIEKRLTSKYEIKNLNLKISKPTILKDCVVSLSN